MKACVDNLAEEINKNKCEDCIDKCLECMGKNCNTKYKDCKCCLKYIEIRDKTLNFIWQKCNKNHQKRLIKTQTNNFLIHANFVSLISINLLCSKTMFIHKNTWMIEKSLMKYHCVKKEGFIVTQT